MNLHNLIENKKQKTLLLRLKYIFVYQEVNFDTQNYETSFHSFVK